MNTVQYIFCGMKFLIYKLQGRSASKLVSRMWFLRLRKIEPLNFLQEIIDFEHYRHTGDKKKVSYIKRTSRFSVKSPVVNEKSVSRNSTYVLLDKQDRWQICNIKCAG